MCPKISVIMPAYNAEKYIAQAIDSILGQTFGDFEFIILNDCSKDRTEEIILSYADGRIVYVKNEENMGVAATLNKGFALAKGAYIARMDADDISLPQRLEKQLAYMEANPRTAVLGCALERFGQDIPTQTRLFSSDPGQMRIDMLFACPLAHPTVLLRKQAIEELGGYDVAFEGLEDYELWCRVGEKYTLASLPEVLFRYRVHPNQVTRNYSQKYLDRLKLLKQRQLEQLGLPVQGEEAEGFYHFCSGKRPEKLAQVEAFCRFLERVPAEPFDPVLLKKNFENLALQLALMLPAQEAKELCKRTKLVSPAALHRAKWKKTVKRLIGK